MASHLLETGSAFSPFAHLCLRPFAALSTTISLLMLENYRVNENLHLVIRFSDYSLRSVRIRDAKTGTECAARVKIARISTGQGQ